MKREFLLAIETIEVYGLDAELREAFPSATTKNLREAYDAGLLASRQIKAILRIAPTVYVINKSIFLRGEESEIDVDLKNGGQVDIVIELFDMTEEMKSGTSYSFYVSHTNFLELGTVEDVMLVKKFFKTRP